MHMLLRTLMAFLKRPYLAPSMLTDTTSVSMRVWPIDLDILLHVNNGVYLSYMDFGRWDMGFRNGIYALYKKKGWYAVVAGATIKYRRSLKLWQKFSIETQILGHDERYFFIQQKFLSRGEVAAVGMVKVRFLSKEGGAVSPTDFIAALELQDTEQKFPRLGEEWFAFESKYLS